MRCINRTFSGFNRLLDVEEIARLNLELYLLAESKCLRFLVKRILNNRNKISVISAEMDQNRRLKLSTNELEEALAQHRADVEEDNEAVITLETSLVEKLEQFSNGLAKSCEICN